MGRNLEKDAIEMAAKNQRILENGLKIFAERTIEKVKMSEVADAAGIGVASLYRYYSTKPALVLGISTWMWEEYTKNHIGEKQSGEKFQNMTGSEAFEDYLDSYIDLYKNHSDMLRFNQFLNVYLKSEDISEDEKNPYLDAIGEIEKRFEIIYKKGKKDGTLRGDLSAKEMFSATLHLMMAAVTRYAVGLVYNAGGDAEKELSLLKEMMMDKFTVGR